MLRAKKKWSLHSCGEVGQHLDSEKGDLQAAANEIRYIGKCVTGDDAGQNTCIRAQEQAALEEIRQPGKIRTLTSNKCQSHQACLLNRSIYDEDDHPAFLARMSHLLQNGRTLTSVLEKCDLYIASIFEYQIVESFPEGMTSWNDSARKLLKSTSKLDDDQVRFLAQARSRS